MRIIQCEEITIENYLKHRSEEETKESLLEGLSHCSKRISSIFFYDAVGSELFEEITRLPEYYLTRTEIPLIIKAANHLQDRLRDVDIVEFGSGDPTKISLILDAVPEHLLHTITYIPVDVSDAVVKQSSALLLERYPGIKIRGVVADFFSQLDVIPKHSKKIFCFLGSTIGNFSPEKAQEFLINVSAIMNAGDILLVGFDMVKNIEILEKAYNDDSSITERFNKNILTVVNTYLDTDFNPDDFDHVAFYNQKHSRIEMHLKALRDLEITGSSLAEPLRIQQGETLHTENSYKFTVEDIYRFADAANLCIHHRYTDMHNWFSLVQFLKKGEQGDV